MMSGPMTEADLAALSDEDILNMVSAPEMEQNQLTQEAQEDTETPERNSNKATDGMEDRTDEEFEKNTQEGAQAGSNTDDGEDGDDGEDTSSAPGDGTGEDSGNKPGEGEESESGSDPEGSQEASEDSGSEEGSEQGADGEAGTKGKTPPEEVNETSEEQAGEVDYKAAYDQIMAPFKAAGKTIQLKSPDDVIQLMQMGAHYTKKMQALQPNLKLLRMLENNDLLDEGKLSYLIDINRKDPSAIQKLVRESGIDPVDIDTSVEPDYRPGNHRVPDEEIAFTQTLEEVVSDPEGKNLVLSINQAWDAQSKEALWSDPSILKVLADQKRNGIYDQISSEIERRRTLGYLGNAPFLQAYKTVGEEMQVQGQLAPVQAQGQATQRQEPAQAREAGQPDQAQKPTQERRVVETRPAQRKTVSNNEKAKAASPTRASPKTKADANFNPLSMTDEEFEKHEQMAGKI